MINLQFHIDCYSVPVEQRMNIMVSKWKNQSGFFNIAYRRCHCSVISNGLTFVAGCISYFEIYNLSTHCNCYLKSEIRVLNPNVRTKKGHVPGKVNLHQLNALRFKLG